MVYLASVCLYHRLTAATAAGWFATEHPAGRRYRSIAADAVLQCTQRCRRRLSAANAGSVTLRADGGGSTPAISSVGRRIMQRRRREAAAAAE